MAFPYVSLVVVNYNGQDIIGKCLQSLSEISYPKKSYETIVVDNASSDRSISIIKKFKVKLITNRENMGYVGVNACLGKARGKYLFILNNDLELDNNCVRALVDVLEKDKSAAIGAPKFRNYFDRKIESSGTWVSRAFYTGHYADAGEEQKLKEIPYLGIEMVRTELAKKFGYIYDPDYFIYAEDLDLSLRMKLMGYRTMYVPEAVVYHMHAITTKKNRSGRMTFLLERNLLMTFFKALSWKSIMLYLPYVLLMRAIALSKDLITLNFRQFYSRAKALSWIAFNFGKVMKRRKQVQKFRKVQDKEVLSVFSEKHMFRKKAFL